MKVITFFKQNKLLTLIFLVYIALLIIIPHKAFQAVNHTSYYLIEMIKILPIIFILTSLIEAWVPKTVIINHLGKRSGFKGIILSFLLGSLSAGPIYAAFPVCKMLLKKGASISNVVIILSAWAVIKVPMLANEAKFLGVKFMVIRWILTVISIIAIAYIVQLLVKRNHLPHSIIEEQNNSIPIGIKINNSYCIGCGACVRLQPDDFKLENKKAFWIKSILDNIEQYQNTISKCPVNAIKFRYDD